MSFSIGVSYAACGEGVGSRCCYENTAGIEVDCRLSSLESGDTFQDCYCNSGFFCTTSTDTDTGEFYTCALSCGNGVLNSGEECEVDAQCNSGSGGVCTDCQCVYTSSGCDPGNNVGHQCAVDADCNSHCLYGGDCLDSCQCQCSSYDPPELGCSWFNPYTHKTVYGSCMSSNYCDGSTYHPGGEGVTVSDGCWDLVGDFVCCIDHQDSYMCGSVNKTDGCVLVSDCDDPVAEQGVGCAQGYVCCAESAVENKRPQDMIYNGPIITDLNQIITPVAKILYYGGLFIGVAFIIYSGYKLMVSQGNPKNTQDAQEQLTAAIVGIVFILLSAAILRVIIGYVFNMEISI